MQPVVLSIAGSDSSAGAGIQADLKSIAANGGYATTVITAITAQNSRGVHGISPISRHMVAKQLHAIFSDFPVAAVKTGMLPNPGIVRAVVTAIRAYRPTHVVCDPVLVSTHGHMLASRAAAMEMMKILLPVSTLVTPNVNEAEVLTGRPVRTLRDMEHAGRQLIAAGARAALIKGGHATDVPACDVLVTPDSVLIFRSDWIDTPHTHGSGCTLAAAIATQLAHGATLCDAMAVAKGFITAAIAHAQPLGHGHGPTAPLYFLQPPQWREDPAPCASM